MPVSKPFVIATEGATTDGRVITADWIKQMAETYEPKTYTALGNIEHYLSMLPDSVFSAYGKVVALSTQVGEVLGEKKLQLLATFDAADAIVALQKAGKKMFCSIEVNPDFAKSGKAYLQGLAFTDNPASLGTEVMQFAAGLPTTANPFTSRKKEAGNLFTAAEPISIEWKTEASGPTAGESLFTKVKDLLGLGKKDTDARFADQAEAITAIAQGQKDQIDQAQKDKAELQGKFKQAEESIAKLTNDLADLTAKLSTTDGDGKSRPPSAGGDGLAKADC